MGDKIQIEKLYDGRGDHETNLKINEIIDQLNVLISEKEDKPKADKD